MEENSKRIVIVGGGLVGALCAYYFGKRGYRIDLYEYREDIRRSKSPRGRSINLSLSNRGRLALRDVGLEEEVLKSAVPMVGRRVHFQNGKCIYSVGRNFLNKFLLTAIESLPNVLLHFDCKLIDVNLKTDELTFYRCSSQDYLRVTGDLIIGADGAFSCLRRSLQSTPLFDCSQTYIDHGYIELRISPEQSHLMKPNHLHIWPRGSMMLIALPNIDKSWTVTLFMPLSEFDRLVYKEMVLEFFKQVFPDVIPLIGTDQLVNDVIRTKPSVLVSIKCSKLHYRDKFLIVGDAAHAIVPFYGQGMNAGFEDCTVLNNLLDKYSEDFGRVLEEFTRLRVSDAHAIADLAMYNYLEMRDLVTRPSYYLKKWFDKQMHRVVEDKWQPLYYSVTFTHTKYEVCLQQRDWQSKVLKRSLLLFGIVALSFSALTFINIT
ncbi:kynurenine 3-monooxygenase isoform X2 [Agrilus planipennis]|uniref:Kynurenine 3-monooxygenase n=1 Tax=Agrilus planipennis TaxID=224129 RepID=A0A1W4WEY4_AGRPL|nr:kynurenine 3-monooxygenase isoform X2 [Agrilus planipennis]